MRISDWSSDVCSSDLVQGRPGPGHPDRRRGQGAAGADDRQGALNRPLGRCGDGRGRSPQPSPARPACIDTACRGPRCDASFYPTRRDCCLLQARRTLLKTPRSEEHTSELQSLMRISYAVFSLKKKHKNRTLANRELLTPQV